MRQGNKENARTLAVGSILNGSGAAPEAEQDNGDSPDLTQPEATPQIGAGIAQVVVEGDPDDDLTGLDWDRYGRFRFVADLIESDNPGASGLKILDVGGDKGLFGLFIREHELYVADKGTTHGDGTKLAMPDSSFDVVVSFDTLEHASADDRGPIIREMARVARDAVYFTYPRSDSLNAQEFAFEVTRNSFLYEHLTIGLPSDAEIKSIVEDVDCDYERHSQGYLGTFVAMMIAIHRVPRDDFDKLTRYFNTHFCATDNFEPALRSIWRLKLRRD